MDDAENKVFTEVFTSFPASSVDPRVGISRSASETDDRFYLSVQVNREDHKLFLQMGRA